ncbi:MAG: lamin tail domain-containing protein, partial [Chthoniobacterales bacterium]
EWQPVIWDVDLSHGHNWTWGKGYFDDALVPTNGLTETQSQDHALYSLVYESAEMREMFTRRLRTLMDEILQPPGTTGGFIETRLREIAAAIDPAPAVSNWTDGDLDAAKWGFDPNFIPNRPREEVERVISSYLVPRRNFLFNTGPGRPLFFRPRLTPNAGNSTPIPDHPQVSLPGLVLIDSVEANPQRVNAAMNQSHEFIVLRNPGNQAVDISGWRLAGAVDHVFAGGTVIPTGAGTAAVDYRGALHVAKDARAFRARPTGPRGGQRRFVQGGYSGQLSARGETVELRDHRDLLVHSFTYEAAPTPAQRFLRVSEIQYHPADPRAADTFALPGVTDNDFEYLELVNTGGEELDLTGSVFTAGLTYTFPQQTLAPGARLILAKNLAAFALRYPSVTTTVLGPYEGQLDNAGERLEITDPSGEVVLDFEYKDGWYPATDGSGRSLVLRDLQTPPDRFSSSTSWGISLDAMGSPGTADSILAQSYRGWDNFHFTSAERDDPAISDPAADPDQDGRPNWMEYALGRNPRVVDQDGMYYHPVISAGQTHAGVRYHRPAHALDLNYVLLAGDQPGSAAMAPVETAVDFVVPTQPGIEQSVLRELSPAAGPRRFLRLRVTLSP